jgi:hypothetical protein
MFLISKHAKKIETWLFHYKVKEQVKFLNVSMQTADEKVKTAAVSYTEFPGSISY